MESSAINTDKQTLLSAGAQTISTKDKSSMNTDKSPEETITMQTALIEKLRYNYAEVLKIHAQTPMPFKQCITRKRQETWALITNIIETNRKLCDANTPSNKAVMEHLMRDLEKDQDKVDMTQEKKEEMLKLIERLLLNESELIELKRGNEERIAKVEPSKETSCVNCGS